MKLPTERYCDTVPTDYHDRKTAVPGSLKRLYTLLLEQFMSALSSEALHGDIDNDMFDKRRMAIMKELAGMHEQVRLAQVESVYVDSRGQDQCIFGFAMTVLVQFVTIRVISFVYLGCLSHIPFVSRMQRCAGTRYTGARR
jgi:hypothetical protein